VSTQTSLALSVRASSAQQCSSLLLYHVLHADAAVCDCLCLLCATELMSALTTARLHAGNCFCFEYYILSIAACAAYSQASTAVLTLILLCSFKRHRHEATTALHSRNVLLNLRHFAACHAASYICDVKITYHHGTTEHCCLLLLCVTHCLCDFTMTM
jgi:lysylphosphatidylglycerol synthetase-like protein (DUF2156 family)